MSKNGVLRKWQETKFFQLKVFQPFHHILLLLQTLITCRSYVIVVHIKFTKIKNSWDLPLGFFKPLVDIDLLRILTFLLIHFLTGHKPRNQCFSTCATVRTGTGAARIFLRGGWSYGSKSLEKEELLVIRIVKEST